jgi:hypothetical protein
MRDTGDQPKAAKLFDEFSRHRPSSDPPGKVIIKCSIGIENPPGISTLCERFTLPTTYIRPITGLILQHALPFQRALAGRLATGPLTCWYFAI